MCGALYHTVQYRFFFLKFCIQQHFLFSKVSIYIGFINFWMSVIGLLCSILKTFFFDICSSYRSVLPGIDLETGISFR
jgi:hypothetical protein